jgi:hypothetical protein
VRVDVLLALDFGIIDLPVREPSSRIRQVICPRWMTSPALTGTKLRGTSGILMKLSKPMPVLDIVGEVGRLSVCMRTGGLTCGQNDQRLQREESKRSAHITEVICRGSTDYRSLRSRAGPMDGLRFSKGHLAAVARLLSSPSHHRHQAWLDTSVLASSR